MAPKDTPRTPKPPRRWRDLGAAARQANHVVAAAVIVFVASILLQSVLAKPLLSAADWIFVHWGTTGAAILGPLLLDGPTTLLLLAIAFPFGRVTAARPWAAGVGLVALVHGFWLSLHFVLGQHVLLWGKLLPALGRSTLIVLTALGVVALMKRGRRVALEADGAGIRKTDAKAAAGKGAEAPTGEGSDDAKDGSVDTAQANELESMEDSDKKARGTEAPGDTAPAPEASDRATTDPPPVGGEPCKMTAMADVPGAER